MANAVGQPDVPALQRPIETLSDAALELLAKGLQLRQRLRFLGYFTREGLLTLGSAPVVGDCWIEYDPSGPTTRLYVQLSVRPRLRVYSAATVEQA